MDIVKYSINKPVSIAVIVILIILFGIIGLNKLPVQLTPDVELPEITVSTTWPGATPYEIEQEIIEEQEEVLKGIKNLIKMESSSYNNLGEISLTFRIDTNINDALLRVSNKLNEVSDYPENADQPSIEAAGAQSSPVIWMMLKTKSSKSSDILKFRTFFENEIKQLIERVEGVGSLFVGGGLEEQLQIIIDSEKIAKHNISISDITDKIQKANKNTSAGVLGIGKKDYRIRTVSKFQNIDDPLDVIISNDGIKRIFLKDLGYSKKGYEKPSVAVTHKGVDVIVVGVRKEQGTNVISLVDRLKIIVDNLNNGILKEKNLYIDWIYDQTPYIHKSISIVQRNVLIGGLLAICVLLFYLRSIRSTIIVTVAIPISIIGTFIFLWIFNRNFNVVSLAGISFAVGMLVDNSIVVLENIDRHRKMGKDGFHAAFDGGREVIGAVIASTLTTVAVFLPIIFIEEEAGQLFRDIAIAITASILISLFVSISVIPSLANKLYKNTKKIKTGDDAIGNFGMIFVNLIMKISDLILKNVFTRIITVTILTILSIMLVLQLAPKAEYLPQGNRNLILNILVPPPGNSVEKRKEIGDYIIEQVKPYFTEDYKNGIPKIKDLFYVAADRFNLFGALSAHETEAKKMMPLLTRIMNSIPDMIGVSIQSGIFETELGGGRSIDVNISGENLHEIINAARLLYGAIKQNITTAQIRPIPSLEISYPEASIIPDKEKLSANGLTETELGIYVDILMDGRQIDDFQPDGVKKIDLVLKTDDSSVQTPEDILNSLIVNKYGNLIRIGDVASLQYTQGMTQIDHLERKRTVKLQVTPPESMAMQTAMEIIEDKILASLKTQGKIQNVKIAVGGNADKLVQTRKALQWNFLLAVIITYLLMSALFENFIYPFIILFTVPLAAGGGFIGYRLVDLLIAPQGFDVVVMLGFIILVGTVVNNAILVVHQSLNNVRHEGMKGIPAISDAVRTRIRPIFMSTTTSIFGLFPLVVSTGSGSELYRGLGSVLLGGLFLSTVFTLFVIPPLLAFFINMEDK